MASSRLEDMIVFARVVDVGSLSGAARALGSTRSAVSKAISRLERHLDARLLHRTTRELSVTAAGHACYPHCARIALEAESTEQLAGTLRSEPQGVLRASCAVSLGMLLAPAIPRFLARYPAVALDVALSDGVVDLVREGFDIGIRLGRLADSTLVARKLVPYRRVICASPAYLAGRGTPKTPASLARHDCIARIGFPSWQLDGQVVRVRGSYRADTLELVRQGALAGVGIALLPSFVIAADIAAGRLVEVLAGSITERTAIYAVYPHQRHLAPSVRAFIDFLVETVRALE